MSDSGDKPHKPTPKKIRDARERGQVAQSKDLTNLASIIVVIVTILLYSHYGLRQISQEFAGILRSIQEDRLDINQLWEFLWQGLAISFQFIGLPVALASFLSLGVNIAQIKGIVISKEFFKLDFNKLNPANNIKSVVSMKNLVKFIKQFSEIVVMSLVAFFIVKVRLQEVVNLYYYPLFESISFILALLSKIFLSLFSIHLVYAALDYVLEQRNLTKQLMMDDSEIKREVKNSEGDPEIKHQRKELHRELTEDDSEGYGLANTSFVLANPTHIAVGVLYQPNKWKLPIITIKAKDNQAQYVFKLAKKHGVPIIRDKWLARKLYALAEIGKFIPSSLTAPVAEVISRNLQDLPHLKDSIEVMKANPEVMAAPLAKRKPAPKFDSQSVKRI